MRCDHNQNICVTMEREAKKVRIYAHFYNFEADPYSSRKLYEHPIEVGEGRAYLAVTNGNRFYIATREMVLIYQTRPFSLTGKYEFPRKSELFFALASERTLFMGTLTPPRAFEILKWIPPKGETTRSEAQNENQEQT